MDIERFDRGQPDYPAPLARYLGDSAPESVAFLDYAEKWGEITPEQARTLHDWYPDPFAWQDRQTR